MTEVKITVNEEFERKRTIRLHLRLLIHLVCWCVFSSVLGYAGYLWYRLLTEDVKDPVLLTLKKFTPCFFTNWNFLFQTIFLTMSLVYDIMEWLDRHDSSLGKKLKFCRDVMFSGMLVPFTLFISTMFWTVYWIDRELVFPKVYDQLVPWWFNHCVHTNISIVLLIETVLQARRHPTHFKLELSLNAAVGILYAIVYYSIYFFANRWLYAVFGIMTWWQVCLYQIAIWTSTFIFYFIQFPINRLFHKEESNDSTNTVHEEKSGIQNGAYTKDSNGIPDNWLKHRSKSEINNSSF